MAVNLQKTEFILSAASPKDFLRDGLPQVAFAGRSNVGKSSVINRLLNRKNFARVGAAPGKTIHINYFKIDGTFYLVDLPGYGYAKVSKSERDRWGKLMETYFAHPELMTLGVMIVDARHKPTADDCTMAQWFKDTGRPMVVVANKVDIMEDPALLDKLRAHVEGKGLELFEMSAAAHQGTQELIKRCAQELAQLPPVVVYEPTYVERPPEVDTSGEVNIQQFDETWVVEAPWLQRLIANVNFSDFESRNWFDRMLRQSGLFDKLEEMGIRDGDIVSMYDLEFEYQR